jgi:hypothetical protein
MAGSFNSSQSFADIERANILRNVPNFIICMLNAENSPAYLPFKGDAGQGMRSAFQKVCQPSLKKFLSGLDTVTHPAYDENDKVDHVFAILPKGAEEQDIFPEFRKTLDAWNKKVESKVPHIPWCGSGLLDWTINAEGYYLIRLSLEDNQGKIYTFAEVSGRVSGYPVPTRNNVITNYDGDKFSPGMVLETYETYEKIVYGLKMFCGHRDMFARQIPHRSKTSDRNYPVWNTHLEK